MKKLLLTLAVLGIAQSIRAQEPVPLDKAQKGARMLTGSLTTTTDLPLATEVDLEKPHAFRAGEVAAIGPEVTRVAVGDRVAGLFMQTC